MRYLRQRPQTSTGRHYGIHFAAHVVHLAPVVLRLVCLGASLDLHSRGGDLHGSHSQVEDSHSEDLHGSHSEDSHGSNVQQNVGVAVAVAEPPRLLLPVVVLHRVVFASIVLRQGGDAAASPEPHAHPSAVAPSPTAPDASPQQLLPQLHD